MNHRTRILALLLALCLLSALCACTRSFTLELGSSAQYSENEIRDAADAVMKKFAGFHGCRMKRLSYAGDEQSARELEDCRAMHPEAAYTRCIVFDSVFRPPFTSGGAWEPNTTYTWTWTVAASEHGGWEVVNYGYG